ncbi:prepilin-type N-terminal cleavage/methylation domain-containing protein [Acinetobacter indicus]|uniref:pilus assembly FimT family protein n=1 Tax=Acinetobacter TaxID=469 RepID=UPI0015D38217|nr:MULTISPECIES: prepilin-type N-terminal cleavage/methylation domain-containing protein [Acinetobacter]MCP0915358.1 prepilin-type N-terminal cleavage/methylation domain-containing protein [Acinetobacter indicus]MCP0918483.1 prepilin-type N-terminal cleavage/methylation domain-containing protein [Acinetobacter indicus]MCP0921149.1 prepilin-type N-terminal cleavage/methylation domain-containing protein [Acinetobacter indicus]
MRKSQGFTLIELMVTIAVLAIVAMMAAPSMNNFRKNQQLKEQENKIKLALAEARTEARLQNKPMIVSFSTPSSNAINTIFVDIDSSKFNFNMRNKKIIFYSNGLADTSDGACLSISDVDGERTKALKIEKLGILSTSNSCS